MQYTQWRKENAFFFANNCNFFIFNIKNYVNTKTTCNKRSFDYLHWLLNYGKLYRKDGVLLALHTSGASSQSSASHLLIFLVSQLQFLREWKLSDRRLYEVFERRLLIWGNPKERNRRHTATHFRNMRSFCAILYFCNSHQKGTITFLNRLLSLAIISSPIFYFKSVILWSWFALTPPFKCSPIR